MKILKIIIIMVFLSGYSFGDPQKEIFNASIEDSFCIQFITVEITGENIIFTDIIKENKHDKNRKDKELKSIGKIKGNQVIFTEQYFNCKYRKSEPVIYNF